MSVTVYYRSVLLHDFDALAMRSIKSYLTSCRTEFTASRGFQGVNVDRMETLVRSHYTGS